jgi:hypothetical protein
MSAAVRLQVVNLISAYCDVPPSQVCAKPITVTTPLAIVTQARVVHIDKTKWCRETASLLVIS